LPGLAALLDLNGSVAKQDRDASGKEIAMAVAKVKLPDGSHLLVVRTAAMKSLLATVKTVPRAALYAALAAVLFAIPLAFVFAFSLARPLKQLATAMKVFGTGETVPVTVHADGEIGELARTFDRMREDVTQKTAALKQEIDVRRKAEEEAARLMERSQLYAAVVNSTEDAVVTKNLDLCITGWNSGAEALFGYTPQEAIGQHIHLIVPENRRAELQEIVKKVREGDRVKHFETVRRKKDGELFEVSLSVSPILDASGKPIGVAKIARDISVQKEAERKLNEAHEQLEQRVTERTRELAEANKKLSSSAEALRRSNDDLGQFAYVASHDLQEPLRAVGGCVELLAAKFKGKLDPDADELIRYAVDGADRMRQLINDLLQYSRVDSRGQPFEPVNLMDLVKDVKMSLSFALSESKAELEYDALPTIVADRVQLHQVFQNLIGNAIKFHGKETPRVRISAEETKDSFTIRIQDNGIGIDPKYFPRLFTIFQRLHTRDEYPGTGIGLAICKKVIERHGGRIWIESNVGKGTIFFFSIPRRGTDESDAATH
jgi:PAS domain S-box-containing protein